jgi:hypothetical protein
VTLSPSMLTDRYELTMLSSWVTDGSVDHQAVFEAFARRLPEGRRFGVVAGLDRRRGRVARGGGRGQRRHGGVPAGLPVHR